MSRKSILNTILVLLLSALAIVLIAIVIYIQKMPDTVSDVETIVLGQSRFAAGSQAAVRVLVRDSKDARPLEGAQVKVTFNSPSGEPSVVFDGLTDADGSADIRFTVPQLAAGSASNTGSLRIDAQTPVGGRLVSSVSEKPVTIERSVRILITTDKPVYQPGQTIHLRALALNEFDRRAVAGETLEFNVADGKGNKVFSKSLTTSDFGVAFADFVLASEVNTGNYKITATLGAISSEKTVEVKNYALPKFAITLTTGKTFYQPGQFVSGVLHGEYFYGKPVSQAAVTLTGYTLDVARTDVSTLQGQTDAAGDFAFELSLPDFLAGSDLESGLARFYLEAAVTDQAAHAETVNLSLPVAQTALIIDAIPEGGTLRPGVENIVYIMVSYPDGAPADANLSLTAGKWQAGESTGPYGVAIARLVPPAGELEFVVSAETLRGESAEKAFRFSTENTQEAVLLRPVQPVYRVGETMKLYILSAPAESTVYLDIVRSGQTVSTQAVKVLDGMASIAVDLTPDLTGVLELHAYRILRSGEFVRDTRLVVVDPADELQVDLQPACPPDRAVVDGLCSFHPGDPVGLDVQVRGQAGEGARSALGLAIVDESVFALAAQQPGFERLYFQLQQELLTPKYEIHGFGVPDLMRGRPEVEPKLLQAYHNAAFASLADALPQQDVYSLYENSHQEALARIREKQAAVRTQFAGWLGAPLFGIACLAALAGGVALWKRNRLGRSLGWTALFWFGLLALMPLTGFTIILIYPVVALLLGVTAIIGFLQMIEEARQSKDASLGWALGLIAFYGLTLGIFLSVDKGLSSSNGTIIFALLSLLVSIPALTALVIGIGLRKEAFTGPGTSLTSLLLLAIFLANCSPMAVPTRAPAPTQMAAMEAPAVRKEAASDASISPEAPRLRQYFPETLLWLPDAVTDPDGRLKVDFTAADSITTWRMTALASTQDGRLGSASAGLRVFQDFFIDADLPAALTVGDEVSIPVGVFNYLPAEQTVRLELEASDWFELRDEPSKELRIAANDIDVAYFRIRVTGFGRRPFKVTAWGSQMSDAILKYAQVYPDGVPVDFTQSGQLHAGTTAGNQMRFSLPAAAIPNTQALTVKVYPGVLSQVVEGLEGMLRMPYGCFEQTSSTTYPNVMVLDYLQASGQISPEVQLTAEKYINLGYQRLTTFEVSGGGFSLFGQAPANTMLTAYGLQEFTDMSRVYPVDPALIERTAAWLMSQQQPDSSWKNDDGFHHEAAWSALQNSSLPVTAYIAWSLVETGYAGDPHTQLGLVYLRNHASSADPTYVTALVANALVALDVSSGGPLRPETVQVLDRLIEQAQKDGDTVYWQNGIPTFVGGDGLAGTIETTSLAALALMRGGRGRDLELANGALAYLVQQKDSLGSWYSTQATITALKALLYTVRSGEQAVDAEVSVLLNGVSIGSLRVTPENRDVLQSIVYRDFPTGQENVLELLVRGEGHLAYQVSGSYYLPWDAAQALKPAPADGDPAEAIQIGVTYDRTELAVDESVQVTVRVALAEPGAASSVMVDLGLPPGFTVQTEDLDALIPHFNRALTDPASIPAAGDAPVEAPAPSAVRPRIERYELTGRQLIVYVTNLGDPLVFSYRLRAKFPLHAQAPASQAYNYYNPAANGQAQPLWLSVLEP